MGGEAKIGYVRATVYQHPTKHSRHIPYTFKDFLFVFFWNRKCNQRDHVYLHILARLHTEDSEDYQ